MDRAQSPSTLPTPPCKVEDYCSSDSSSPSLKQAFQPETEGKSSKIIVNTSHDNRNKQLETGDDCHKGHAEKAR